MGAGFSPPVPAKAGTHMNVFLLFSEHNEMPKETVLIVDDEHLVRRTLQQRLEKWGYHVSLAKDGITAQKRLQEDNPDLIILDVKLPNGSGIEVLSDLKKRKLQNQKKQQMSRQGNGQPSHEVGVRKILKQWNRWDPFGIVNLFKIDQQGPVFQAPLGIAAQ